MPNTYLKRDLSVSETIYKWTWSAWIKRGSLNVAGAFFKSRADSNNWVQAYFDTSNKLVLQSYKNGGYHYDFRTTREFRDANCWYHFLINVDSSQSVASDRVRIYVNGEKLSSYTNHSGGTTVNNLTNGDTLIFNTSDSGTGHTIGSWNAGTYFNGCMSHVHYSSGYSYAPTVFGSTDSVTGEWKINTNPTFTLGGNGYTVLKDGNTITDQSSNSNDFTLGGGTLTKTEDCPDNVFATYVPAWVFSSGGHDVSHGNTVGTNSTSSWYWRPTSLAATSGKFYAEVKVTADGGGTLIVGITNIDDCKNAAPVDSHFGKSAVNKGVLGFAWYSDDGKIYYPPNASTSAITYGTYGANDILMLAMDLDNGAFYIGKNGSWLNSGDPTSGSSRTGAVNTWTAGTGTWVFADAQANSGEVSWNFGNGYFKTTAVASAGTNASGNGIFEYDVPASFTAMSTKGLNL